MKKIFLTLPLLGLLIGLPVELSAQEQIPRDWEQKTYVERGKYLVYNLAECVGCHTPLGPGGEGDPNMKLYLSGVPAKFAGKKKGPPQIAGFRGRKGARYYPKNLTPDPKTGIGKWTESEFITAMRTGLTPDRKILDPFMPWGHFKGITDRDLKSMWAYLETVKAIKNKVPKSIPRKK